MPTPVWLSGFEHGVSPLNATNNALVQTVSASAPTVVSDITRTGSYTLKFAPALMTDHSIQMVAATSQVHVYSYGLYVDTLPSGADQSGQGNRQVFGAQCEQAGQAWIGLAVDPSSGALRSYNYWGSFSWLDAGVVLTTGRWYQIDVLLKTTGTTWTCNYRVDGTSFSGSAGSLSAQSTMGQMQSYCSSATQGVFRVDDLVYSQTEADYPLGKHFITKIVPEGAASHQSITLSEWQTTSNFSSFTNFSSQTETSSSDYLSDLDTADGIRLNGGASGQAGNGRWNLSNVTFTPLTPVLDNFNRADGALTDAQGFWYDTPATLGVVSNVCTATPATGTVYTNSHYAADQEWYFTFVSWNSSAETYIWARLVARDYINGYQLKVTNLGQVMLIKNVSGSPTTLVGSGLGVIADGDTLLFRLRGSKLEAWRKRSGSWTLLCETTDTTYTSYGYAGISLFNSTTIDNFSGGALPEASSGLPIALRSLISFADASTGTNNLIARIRAAGGTTSDIFNGDPASTTWQYAALLSTSVPGGSGWTTADVEGLQFEIDSTDTDPAIYVGGFLGEMAYYDVVMDADEKVRVVTSTARW